MESHDIFVWLVIGAIAGWVAGLLVRGGGFGLIGDIVVSASLARLLPAICCH